MPALPTIPPTPTERPDGPHGPHGHRLDPLSAPARAALRLNVEHAYTALVPASAGPAEARAILESLDPTGAVADPAADRDDARCLLAALWLWHDFLPQSHALSQRIDTPSGSLWHGILHRREGDFSNSKYWFAKCEGHPVYPSLAAQADDVVRPYPVDKSLFRLTRDGWDAAAFADLCEAVHEAPDDPRRPLVVALQQLEWRTLFDHCLRGAVG